MKLRFQLAFVSLFVLGAVAVGQGPTAISRSPHGPLDIACQNCHTSLGWKPIRSKPEFDHNRTKFPLRGMHESVTCNECHTKPVFSNTGTRCADCHADIHKRQFGAKCEQCHTVKGWNVQITQIKDHMNRFPLLGAHATLDCDSCHKSAAVGQFEGLSTQCYSCHATDFKNASNPSHVGGGFSTNCQQCHVFDNWVNVNFDHSATGFPLTGMHTVPPRQCADCHVNNNFNITNTTCVSCHLKDYQGSTNPNHVQLGFSQTCQSCHTTSGWSPANFDHSQSGFPLTGQHTVPPRACTDCHKNNNYNITDTSCVSCHMTDYQNTNNPNHAQQGIPTTCEVCHSTNGWSPANFDHSKTGFPLTNSHAVPPRQCSDCHINNNYNITNTACVSCHQNDYNKALSPVDHPDAHFPTTCEQCHDTNQWSDGTFNHAATGWPLTNSHTVPPRACTDCHVNNNYNITNTACVSCHQNDYNQAKNPDHVAAKFSTTCEQCHDTLQWSDGKFDHSQTGWALTNSHTVPPRTCTDCHVNNNYNITNTACVSCHQNDYNQAKNPDHVAAKFPTTCEMCHDTLQWSDGKFDHSQTGWALTNSHQVPPRVCTDCHVNNNYNITNTDCFSCHSAEYYATTDPNHVAAHFPTTCATCHDTIKWADGKFDHTWWDMNHGGAKGNCATCHTNPNDYSVFTCTNCHTQSQTDREHQGIKGYVYNSVNCYQCHKNGGGGGGARRRN